MSWGWFNATNVRPSQMRIRGFIDIGGTDGPDLERTVVAVI